MFWLSLKSRPFAFHITLLQRYVGTAEIRLFSRIQRDSFKSKDEGPEFMTGGITKPAADSEIWSLNLMNWTHRECHKNMLSLYYCFSSAHILIWGGCFQRGALLRPDMTAVTDGAQDSCVFVWQTSSLLISPVSNTWSIMRVKVNIPIYFQFIS